MGVFRVQPDVLSYLYKRFHRVMKDGGDSCDLTLSEAEFVQFLNIYTEGQVTLFGRVIASLNCWCALFGIIAGALNVFSQFSWNKFSTNLSFIGNLFWVIGALAIGKMAITPIQLNQTCHDIILHQLLQKSDEGRRHGNPFWASRTIILFKNKNNLF